MQTPGFFHQFPKLQPNNKLEEGLKADEYLFDSEKGITWRNRLLLYSGEVMVLIGKRLQRKSGICIRGQTAPRINKSTVSHL